MFVYIFFHVHPVGVGADLSCPYPRNTPKWRCNFPPLILQYIVPYPRTPQNGVAYSHRWHCNTSYRTHVIPQNGVAIHHTAPTKFHKMALRFSTIGIAIPHTVPTNTHKMALRFVIFRTSRQIEKERSNPMMFASLLCFMC